ncbi:MAG: family 16 glycosylhydrolase [Granulosicoccus sp.]
MSSISLAVRFVAFLISLFIWPALASADEQGSPDSLNTSASSKVLVNAEWVLISLPGEPGVAGTVASIFGDDLPVADLDRTWRIYRWRKPGGNIAGYEQLTGTSRLYAGEAYWIVQITGSPVTLDLPSATPATATRQVRGCHSVAGCFSIDLGIKAGEPVGWNLVGLSQTSPIELSGVRVLSESGACSTGCTLSEAETANMVFGTVYRHNGEATGYELLTDNSSTSPWEGFWLAVLPGAAGQTISLEVPRKLAAPQTPDLSDYQMVFNDEFNGPTLDANKWNTGFLWGPYVIINNEEQFYVDSLGMHEGFSYNPFSFTPEGTLKITAEKVSDVGGPPPIPDPNDAIWGEFLEYRYPRPNEQAYVESNVKYLSGMINTYEAFKFTHGYVEARVKVPKGKGLWPAFWTLPTHYVADVPEIDIMEYIGQYPNETYHTYHYFDIPAGWKTIRTPTYETIGPDYSKDFHVFSMSWDPEQIIWYVDGMETRRVDSSEWVIPNQAMYILANLAVGGNWPTSPDPNTEFPAVFELDYIRAYKKEMDRPLDLNQYELVFSDDFTGSTLDPDKWTTRFLWGPFLTINNEEQHYIDSHGIDSGLGYTPFSVSNGNLTITAAATGTQSPANTVPPKYPAGDPFWDDIPSGFYQPDYTPKNYTSGIITSRDSFRFTHGYAEIRAKIPAGDGLWPAFWLLNSYYVGRQPEIDIMEIIGEDPGTVAHTYHWTNAMGMDVKSSHRAQGGSGDLGFGDGFHTYGVQWTHDTITWFVDGQETATFTDPDVSYQIMYVIANLAVGGAFNTKPVDTSKLPAELVIDYIKVYQEKRLP